MCPKIIDTIRPGIEVCTEDPRELSAEALLLPWRGDARILSDLLGAGAPGVFAQLSEYPGDRDIRLSSAGMLPLRFLMHLTLPGEGAVDVALLRERFSESFRHARVLALCDLVIPMNLFADASADFSALAEVVWGAWSENARDRMRVRLLVKEGDLRGEYLRRFLQRRRGGELARARKGPHYLEGRLEGALRPALPQGLDLEQALERLLEDYREGQPLDDAMAALGGPMMRAFDNSLDPGEKLEDLPGILRVLGSGLVQRLPWELLRKGSTFLGERFVLPRGTSFFVLGGRNKDEGDAYRIEVHSEDERRGPLSQELRNLLHRVDGKLADQAADVGMRVVLASGSEAWERLLAEENPRGGELLFLEMPQEWQDPVDTEELAGCFLAHGFRRVLSPLVPFRDSREARIFRMAFFEQYFRGHGAGGALHYAQRALLEAFGIHSGWFLYRIFGQAEDQTYSTQSSIRRGMDLSGF